MITGKMEGRKCKYEVGKILFVILLLFLFIFEIVSVHLRLSWSLSASSLRSLNAKIRDVCHRAQVQHSMGF